jgi:hypothetical protein
LKEPEWLTISPDKPCSLKIGAPLRPVLLTHRRGRMIGLSYQLLDGEGRRYCSEKRDQPPRFTVYCDGYEIASGSFEYG